MKRTFQVIGLISLLGFSFFLTDKTATVIKNLDDIMIEIKNNKSSYEQEGTDAVIKDDGIIPGISKKTVNVNKSYNNMKEYGKYNDNLYVFDYTIPNISIKNNKDKYIISGNSKKRMISLNFLVADDTEIEKIVEILNNNNIKGGFFVNEDWLSNNMDLVYNLITNKFIFGIDNTDENNYEWMNTILTKADNQAQMYCFYDDKVIDKCKELDGYTIKGITIDSDYYNNVTKSLKSGAIITFKVDDNLIKNLDRIIRYIFKKGYAIENLHDHIEE